MTSPALTASSRRRISSRGRTADSSSDQKEETVEAHVIEQVEELYGTISERSGTYALEHFVEDVVEWIERDRDALMCAGRWSSSRPEA